MNLIDKIRLSKLITQLINVLRKLIALFDKTENPIIPPNPSPRPKPVKNIIDRILPWKVKVKK
jgi:hypothetical protein